VKKAPHTHTHRHTITAEM